jgi:hypothetical protein
MMETIESAIKCSICRNILESPVLLPCSDSICKKHVTILGGQELHCLECDTIHAVPAAGFLENKALSKLLEANIEKVKFPTEYTHACDSMKALAKCLDEFRSFQKDPFKFRKKTIGDLRRETDIIRDQYKLKIDHRADEIIKELNEYEQECELKFSLVNVLSEMDRIAPKLNKINAELTEWQKNQSLSFDSNQIEWKIIKEYSEFNRISLEKTLHDYRDATLLKKLTQYQLKLLAFSKIELDSDRKYIV